MAKKTHGLGRGLDALLPETQDLEAGLQQIPIGDIDPNQDQPRQTFDQEALAQLAQSIRDQGILQPLLVVPGFGGRYTLVAGERRWRAARMAELDTVPCIVRDMDIAQQMEIALIENLQREDLNPMEEAAGIRGLMDQCGYTQENAAARLGMSRPNVANLLRLLTLPEEIRAMIREGKLSAGHGRVLAGLASDALKKRLAAQAIAGGWSVRRLEEAAAEENGRQKPKPEKKPMPVELHELQERFLKTMGVRTTLVGNAKKGRITLTYSSADELEHINDMLLQLSGDAE